MNPDQEERADAGLNNIILGTAGHIDHGKTEAIKMLTGIDTDRLKEEKERGITIDIGFAYLDLPDDRRLGIIDVPGHEKFVKNMLAGAVGIDLVLLVVAADESIMPQTREHLDICRLLKVRHGLIALTKCDMVDEEIKMLVEEEVSDFVKGTFLESAPIVRISSKTKEGIDELKRALIKTVDKVAARETGGVFRLPIDRVFTIKGFGTVVTGTVQSGEVSVDDRIIIAPQNESARVRGIEVHETKVDKATAGQRTALNLQGISKHQIKRGHVATSPEHLPSTYMINAHMEMLASASKPLSNRARIRLHAGAQEIMGRVILLDREILEPADQGFVQIRLEQEGVFLPGDYYVIRSYSPSATIGGGVILELTSNKAHRFRNKPLERLKTLKEGSLREKIESVFRNAGFQGIQAKKTPLLVFDSPEKVHQIIQEMKNNHLLSASEGDANLYYHVDAFKELRPGIMKLLEDFHRKNPLAQGLKKEKLKHLLKTRMSDEFFNDLMIRMQENGSVVFQGGLVRRSDFSPEMTAEQEKAAEDIIRIYRTADMEPPLTSEVLQKMKKSGDNPEELIRFLLVRGDLIKVQENLIYHRDAIEKMKRITLEHLEKNEKITVGDFKGIFKITRKFAVPLLEYLDQANITVRRGNERFMSPAARE